MDEEGDGDVKYYDTEEVAVMLRLTTQTVRDWCRRGRFPGYIRNDRRILIPEDAVEAKVRELYG